MPFPPCRYCGAITKPGEIGTVHTAGCPRLTGHLKEIAGELRAALNEAEDFDRDSRGRDYTPAAREYLEKRAAMEYARITATALVGLLAIAQGADRPALGTEDVL